MFKIILVWFLYLTTSCLAASSHVVHNVFKGGFSLNGYDLFYDDGNIGDIKLGDLFYIKSEEIEKISKESFRKVLLLSDPSKKEVKYFKSRIISNQKSMFILEVEKLESGEYAITLEDGAKYKIYHQYDALLSVQAGDLLSFEELPYYALYKNIYSNFEMVLEDGSRKWLGTLPSEELSFWKAIEMPWTGLATLFFGGPVLDWEYSINRTWSYPYCLFYTGTITRDNTILPGFFRASGLFRKPNPLAQTNTFRVRYAGIYTAGRNHVELKNYYVVEFFDFHPGSKLNMDNPGDLKKLENCRTLKFIKKVNEKKFIFETLKKEQISCNRSPCMPSGEKIR